MSERNLLLLVFGLKTFSEVNDGDRFPPEVVRLLDSLFPRMAVTGGAELWGGDNLDLEYHALSPSSGPTCSTIQ